jgi:hypothetical protein
MHEASHSLVDTWIESFAFGGRELEEGEDKGVVVGEAGWRPRRTPAREHHPLEWIFMKLHFASMYLHSFCRDQPAT